MMFGSAILEVVIGLAFLYLLLSLICSALNEWIAGILALRSKTLREGIENLLDDRYAPGLLERFLDHSLIRGLSRKGTTQSFPSYIPARTFATALLDTVAPTAPGAGARTLLAGYKAFRDELTNLSKANSPLAKSLLSLVDQAGGDPQKIEQISQTLHKLEQTRLQLVDRVQGLPDDLTQSGSAKELLERLTLVEANVARVEAEANAMLDKLQGNIETYFNSAMERVGGWYKRRAQVIIIIIAFSATVLLNADSITVANQLLTSPTLRAAIVANAERYVQQQPAAQSAGATATNETTAAPDAVGSAAVANTLQQLDELMLPLGWRELPAGIGPWFLKIMGLLVTIVAISFGAPFWFGVLNKLINLRMSGDKPEEKT